MWHEFCSYRLEVPTAHHGDATYPPTPSTPSHEDAYGSLLDGYWM